MKIRISGFADERKQIAALSGFISKTYDVKQKQTSREGIYTTWLEIRPPVKDNRQKKK
jgi:hypothetical protein